MIIPDFKIDQNEKNIFIKIYIKYIKISDAELYIWENDFKFYLNPYFLKFSFNQKWKNEKYDIKYNFEENYIILTLDKLNEGEFFENLNIISNLKPLKKKDNKKEFKIEILDNSLNNIIIIDEQINYESFKIGFGFKFCNFFKDFEEEKFEILYIDSENINFNERKKAKEDKEEYDFNFEHYLFDTYDEDKNIEGLLLSKIKLPLEEGFIDLNKVKENYSLNEILNKEEKIQFNWLKNQELMISKEYIKNIELILIDLLYSYLYDKRVNYYEDNIESGWNINKLSNNLSSNFFYSNLKENLISNVRRSLIFPIYRNFKLGVKIIEDLIYILELGKLGLLKSLINIKNIFNKNKPREFLNILYLNDWIHYTNYGIKEEELKNLVKKLKEIKIEKNDINLDLVELELENLNN